MQTSFRVSSLGQVQKQAHHEMNIFHGLNKSEKQNLKLLAVDYHISTVKIVKSSYFET